MTIGNSRSDDEVGARREEIHRLLHDCADHKMLRGGTACAERLVHKAIGLTDGEPRLAVWRRLAHYRLAHLMLRTPGNVRRLKKIDRHLTLAAGLDGPPQPHLIGPLPAIYRLAVLHRLQVEDDSPDRRIELRKTLDLATRQVAAFRAERIHENPQLQHGVANLLELATYFLGERYDDLSGLGELDPLRTTRQSAWVLLTNDTSTAQIAMTRDFAGAELKSWESACPEALVLRIERPHPTLSKGASIKRISVDEARLIGLHLLHGSMEKRALVQTIGDRLNDQKVTFRQIKSRLIHKLESFAGLEDLTLFDEDADGRSRLTAEIEFVGIAHRATVTYGGR